MAEREAQERTLTMMLPYLLVFPVPEHCSIETGRRKVSCKKESEIKERG